MAAQHGGILAKRQVPYRKVGTLTRLDSHVSIHNAQRSYTVEQVMSYSPSMKLNEFAFVAS
jgi:hypothetical protein